MEGPGADSEEKRVLASDLDTVMVDSLKALDLDRPIREADISACASCNAVDTHHKSMTVFAGIDSGGLGAFPKVIRRCSQVNSRSGVLGTVT